MKQLPDSEKINPHKDLAKPFIKWVGGKAQLLGQLEKFYPLELKTGKINKYFELFVGGGAVFFEINQKFSLEKAFINDINQDLILAYKVIRDNPQCLIKILSKLQEEYLIGNRQQREKLFYQIRQDYNQQRIGFDYKSLSQKSINRVALMIFLNKTCFNGLYRTNQKGDFNVPIGKYKNPAICNSDNILKIAKILQNITIMSGNYDIYNQFIDDKSFVYLDPPYRPISKTSSFTAYAKYGFNDASQIKLSQYYRYLDEECQAKIMLSNSDPQNTDSQDVFFDNLYSQYNIHRVSASRMVNSKAMNRGKITELLITNY